MNEIPTAPYRDYSATAIRPYEGPRHVTFHPVPPEHLLYAEAGRLFDALFIQALWRWKQMLRQALDDSTLVGWIRAVYLRRRKRRVVRGDLARALAQRASETAAVRIPFLDPVWDRPLSDFT